MMELCFGVLVSIVLIMKFGVLGAAWGTLLGSLVTGTVLFLISQHYYRIQWEAKKIVSIFGVFCVSTLMILFLMNDSFGYIPRFGLKLLSIFIFIYLGTRFRMLTKYNFRLIRNIITFKKDTTALNMDITG